MILIDQSVELITEKHPGKKLELIGRVCWKSEDKITEDSHIKFLNMIRKKGHTSVLEHVWRVVFIDTYFESCNTSEVSVDKYVIKDKMSPDVYINQRAYELLTGSTMLPSEYELYEDVITTRFITNRAIANELVRHRVASFTQISTRYVNYKGGMKFIKPLWFDDKDKVEAKCFYELQCKDSEHWYSKMIDKGIKPQDARDILPLGLATELVMTATKDQWLNTQELRDGYTGERKSILGLRLHRSAHPQVRQLMGMLVCSMYEHDKLTDNEHSIIQDFIKKQ